MALVDDHRTSGAAGTTDLADLATDATDAPGRRARKKQHTRTLLIDAAARLFAERGFEETTTEAIADEADVAQRTFFRHFPSKEAVLYGDLDQLEAALAEAIVSRPRRERPVVAVAAALRTPAASFNRDRARTLLQARLAAASPSVSAYSRAVVQRGLERAITAALAERMQVDPSTDPRPEVIAGAAMSALRAALRTWAAGGGTDDLGDLVAAGLLRAFGERSAPTAQQQPPAGAGLPTPSTPTAARRRRPRDRSTGATS